MKHYSIRLKISVLFVIVFVLICALAVICINLTLNLSHDGQNEYHENVVKSLVSNYNAHSDINITHYLSTRGFSVVDDEKLIRKIKEDGKYYFKMVTDFGLFSSISYDYALFLELMNQNEDLIFQTKKDNFVFEFMVVSFVVSVVLAFILYLSIMRSLNPLGKLRRQIALAVSGEEFLAQDFKRDDIGEIATDFSDTIEKMHELVESRRLFLRTIMHEFKTPIGKGRIIAEMMKEKKQKERLVAIFKRLDALIEESAKIESLYSKNYKLQIKTHNFDEILARAKGLLLYDDFDKKVRIKKKGETLLEADIDSFALVIKNLIENAIKYSDNGICFIECYEERIIIKNKGKPLKQPYTEYLKPFSRDKDSKKEGMGLGLYIVDKTCKSHNFTLSYEYMNSYHCFTITITPPPLTTRRNKFSKTHPKPEQTEINNEP